MLKLGYWESLVWVRNGWGCGIAYFFGLWNFEIRSLKCGQNRSSYGISGIFLQISASQSNFGLWEMAILYSTNPCFFAPTKCQLINECLAHLKR